MQHDHTHESQCNFQKPEEGVPLDKISAVDYMDDDPNEPYQFMVTIEGKRSWKLKATSEAS